MRNIESPAQKQTVASIEKSGAIHFQYSMLLSLARDARICRITRYTKNAETPPSTAPMILSTCVM